MRSDLVVVSTPFLHFLAGVVKAKEPVLVQALGLDVPDARRLKTLEDENTRLKKLQADAMLDNAILKDVAAKNSDARRKAGCSGSCLPGARSEPAAGV